MKKKKESKKVSEFKELLSKKLSFFEGREFSGDMTYIARIVRDFLREISAETESLTSTREVRSFLKKLLIETDKELGFSTEWVWRKLTLWELEDFFTKKNSSHKK